MTDPHYGKYKDMQLEIYIDGVWPWSLTLIQFMTLDSWSNILRNMMKAQAAADGSYDKFFLALLFSYMMLTVLVVVNLVTAMIIDSAMVISTELQDGKGAAEKVELDRLNYWVHILR